MSELYPRICELEFLTTFINMNGNHKMG